MPRHLRPDQHAARRAASVIRLLAGLAALFVLGIATVLVAALIHL